MPQSRSDIISGRSDEAHVWPLLVRPGRHAGQAFFQRGLPHAQERDAALQAGQLDGYFGDILNTIVLIRAGQELRIVTTVFHTHPDFRMFGIVPVRGAGLQFPADFMTAAA